MRRCVATLDRRMWNLTALLAVLLAGLLNASAPTAKVAKRHTTSVCKPYQYYCGIQLRDMGYSNTVPNALYKCRPEGDAHYYEDCDGQCESRENERGSFCHCTVGALYCGHELSSFNFYFTADVNDPHTLYRCDGQTASAVEECQDVCIDKPTGDSECGAQKKCTDGMKYCGQEIAKQQQHGYSLPHSLFNCHEVGEMTHFDWDKDCPNGCFVNPDTSEDSSCVAAIRVAIRPPLCSPSRFYCGAELAEFGYSKTEPHMLYRCSFDRDGHVALHCDRTECTASPRHAGASFCACIPGEHYCGYELLKMNFPPSDRQPIDDHSLYRCATPNHADWEGRCDYGCSGSSFDGTSRCNTGRPNNLPAGLTYCGHQLGPSHYHPGWAPQRLYLIVPGGSAVPMMDGDCPSGCVGRDDGQSYCDAADHIAERP